jgi:hypothetical protein
MVSLTENLKKFCSLKAGFKNNAKVLSFIVVSATSDSLPLDFKVLRTTPRCFTNCMGDTIPNLYNFCANVLSQIIVLEIKYD